jgi:creatinine amidohydrolase
MRFEELNWFDIESYLRTDDRLILILGACEQHGYLSLLTDVKIPMALADIASKKTNVLVAPTVNFGISPYFRAYPGTISVRATTMMDIVEDVLRCAYDQGFRRILILNGHGGNEPLRARIHEVINQLSDFQVNWYSWWQSHSVQTVALKHELKSYHAGWIEAFPFTRVCDLPAGSKISPPVTMMMGANLARQTYGDGVFGGFYEVEQAILDEIFEAALQDVLQLLKFE